jgi:hypothetical protein
MPTPARAVAPLAGKQAPSFYRYKVGDDEVTVIHDGARSFPMPDTFVKNVSKDEALAAAVVNTGCKLVLIDSGRISADRQHCRAGPRGGRDLRTGLSPHRADDSVFLFGLPGGCLDWTLHKNRRTYGARIAIDADRRPGATGRQIIGHGHRSAQR